jgi:hypothetical protein
MKTKTDNDFAQYVQDRADAYAEYQRVQGSAYVEFQRVMRECSNMTAGEVYKKVVELELALAKMV